MDVSDYMTTLGNDDTRSIIIESLSRIGLSQSQAEKKADQLIELFREYAMGAPEFIIRIDTFLISYIDKIIREYGNENNNALVKRRSRDLPDWLRGRRRISGRSHYTSDLALALQFRHANKFDYSNPAVSQAFAFTFVARVLLTLGLEKPAVKSSNIFNRFAERIKKREAYEDYDRDPSSDLDIFAESLQVKKLRELLTQRFRDWNCRQLPNLPRGAYSSLPGRRFSDKPEDLSQSQIRLENDIRKVNSTRASRNH